MFSLIYEIIGGFFGIRKVCNTKGVFRSGSKFLSSVKYWTKLEQFLGWLSVNNKLLWLYNKYTN
jgi:hypothetical protein